MNLAKERMLLNQSRLDTLNEEYNNKSNPSNKETKEYEKKKAQLEKTRNDAKKKNCIGHPRGSKRTS